MQEQNYPLNRHDRLIILNTTKMNKFVMDSEHQFQAKVRDFLEETYIDDEAEGDVWYKKIVNTQIYLNEMIIFWKWE